MHVFNRSVRRALFVLCGMLLFVFSGCSNDEADDQPSPPEPASIEAVLTGTYTQPTTFDVSMTTQVNNRSEVISIEAQTIDGSVRFENDRGFFAFDATASMFFTASTIDSIQLGVFGGMQFIITGEDSFRLFVDDNGEPLKIMEGISISEMQCTMTLMTADECIFEGSFNEDINIGGASNSATPVVGTLRLHLKR